MSARKAQPTAAFVVTDAELDELETPWVAQIGTRSTVTLKSQNMFSLDDYFAVADQADQDPRTVIDLLAASEEDAATIRGLGQVVLSRMMKAWFASSGVASGESDSSET